MMRVLLIAAGCVALSCDSSFHRPPTTVAADDSVDLALEPSLTIAPCTKEIEAAPGATISLCVRVTTAQKKKAPQPKAGEAVVFHPPQDDGILKADDSGVVITDSKGEAHVDFTVATSPGIQTLIATTAAGMQAQLNVVVREPDAPIDPGLAVPKTDYAVTRGVMGGVSKKVFGKSVSGLR